jgi:hypothetical protein
MDFFERWFNISPDGGDGSAEVLWIVGIACAVVGIIMRRRLLNLIRFRSAIRQRPPQQDGP